MARPIKRSCDYYPHPAAERNTPEAKALRVRFGPEGYGVYCMIMELLCGADEFTYAWDELNIELLAGDFGTTGERLLEIATYMARLKMIEITGETLRSTRLEATLKPVLEKRILMQERYSSRVSESETTDTAAETTQRKGKERKGKESVKENSDLRDEEVGENPDAPHPAETAVLQWANQHQEWLRKPILEFSIKKSELDGGSLTGELRKFCRYYLTKSRPHAAAKFENNPTDFVRYNWRDWIRNIADRRAEKQQPAGAKNDELHFTDDEIYALAFATVGETKANELHAAGKLFYPRKAPDKTQARERIQYAARELEKSRAGPAKTNAPTHIANLTSNL
jgi:Domain of unknown function (DUF4373)